MLLVLWKETLISDLNKYMSCTYDHGILMFDLSVQGKQVQSQESENIDHAHQPEIWRCMYSRDGAVHGCRRDDHISSQQLKSLMIGSVATRCMMTAREPLNQWKILS